MAKYPPPPPGPTSSRFRLGLTYVGVNNQLSICIAIHAECHERLMRGFRIANPQSISASQNVTIYIPREKPAAMFAS